MGLIAGKLDDVAALLENSVEESVTTHNVVRELRHLGIAHVDARPFRRQYRRLHKKEGLTQADLARLTGRPQSQVIKYVGPKAKVMPYGFAVRLASVLGMPESGFKFVRVKGPRYHGKRLRPRERRLTGGRLDESYSLVRKSLQELDRATGQSDKWGTMEAWEHLYAAEEIIGKALKRAK